MGYILILTIINVVLCNLITKRQIKKNISLFYSIHKSVVDKIVEDKKEDDLIEKI